MVTHYERTGEKDGLAVARACGEQLLLDDELNTDGVGFAHGTSGVAYTLARLAAATGNSEFATEALARFERLRSVYDDVPDDQRWWWCRGVPGVAVAFAETAELLDELSVPEWVSGWIERSEELSLDHFCCGNAGRAATALTVACRLDEDKTAACRLAESLQNGTAPISLANHGQAVSNPTFFDGLPGVAYTVARVLGDEHLPSVVSFR
ncbi:MAG: Lantibiotic modifying enzyme [halophilic archaeon J07HB67]|nr:MAG: Lantibiotic modifying enzyme [halophilic archaeon J07HB67]